MNYGWSTGLYDCCSDPGIFCQTFWCPCITFGKIAAALPPGSSPFAGDETSACFAYWGLGVLAGAPQVGARARLGQGGGRGGRVVFSAGGAESAGANVAEAYLVAKTRQALRQAFGIPPPPDCWHSDAFEGLCCARCALCQEMREIEIRAGAAAASRTVLRPPAVMSL